MKFLVRNKPTPSPEVSIILLDWDCRESYHIFDYLAAQTVPRDQYEILWIEYYDKVAPEIQRRLDQSRQEARPPPVDIWLVMETPHELYYHKHLMYNVGIALSSGKIVVICDSDAMVRPSFVESIIRSFDEDPNIVLHLDEVRNNSDRFHPFNYPDWDDIIGDGAINWTGETTTGIVDQEDPLHSRNYGACMAALRKDLIAIGGADEHIDYLGHICGPYEMTFRLVNTGRREVWHNSEWMYHVWHPGQAGDCNYAGPHDGRHMSSTSLATRVTLRAFPLLESRVIRLFRAGQTLSAQEVLQRAFRPEYFDRWKIENLGARKRTYNIGDRHISLQEARRRNVGPTYAPTYPPYRCHPGTKVKLCLLLYLLTLAKLARTVGRKIRFRKTSSGWGFGALAKLGKLVKKMLRPFGFAGTDSASGKQKVLLCWQCLCRCATKQIDQVILYEMGEIAKILSVLSGSLPVRVKAVCPGEGGARRKLLGWRVIDEAELIADDAPIIVATFESENLLRDRLLDLGVPEERILLLQ